MTHEAGLSTNIVVLRVILIFTAALLSACANDDKLVEQQTEIEAEEAPLPVREWYPTPKHMQQPQAYIHPSAIQPGQMMPAQPPNQGAVSQQPWAVKVPQAVYTQPSPVIVYQAPQYAPQAPQYAPQAQQWGWTYQQPAVQAPQPWTWTQPVVPGYQNVPRPWGDITGANNNRQADTYSGNWPQNSYYAPGGAPASGSHNVWGTGQYGTVPPGVYYGNVW